MESLARSALTNLSRAAGIFWQFARIGERLSPYVSLICVIMAVSAVYGLFPSLVTIGR